MRRILAFAFLTLILALAQAAGAAERCAPRPVDGATVSTFPHTESHPDGEWSVHFCKTTCAWVPQVRLRLNEYALKYPTAASAAEANYSMRALYHLVYELNATADIKTPPFANLRAAAYTWADANEPLEPPCVTKNPTAGATTGRVYYLDRARNQLGHVSATRVPVGTKCHCYPGQRLIPAGSGRTYCGFHGSLSEPQTEVTMCGAP